MVFDVVIVGGSFAGISAALQLARGRRAVLLIDGGQRRNRFASSAHGFLGQDGRDSAEIHADAKAELFKYKTVVWHEDFVKSVLATEVSAGDLASQHSSTGLKKFVLSTEGGEVFAGRRLIIASGVVDELPEITGLAERFGKSVFHCPYCHGYELNEAPLGVIASSEQSMHHALMLPDWGPTTLFLNDAFEPNEEQMAALEMRGVAVERERIVAIEEHAKVCLADGRVAELAGLFTLTRTRIASGLVQQLGCVVEPGPMGDFISTDMRKETSVPGVFACGDVARAAGSLALAVGDGVMAGVGAHQSLMFRTD